MTNTQQPSKRPSPSQDLADLDRRLVSLLVRRTKLLAKIASDRRAAGKPVVSAPQEKALWAAWSETVHKAGLSDRLAKQLFIAVNALGYDAAQAPAAREQVYLLTPASGAVDVSCEAPASTRKAMYFLALAAFAGSPASVGPVVLSDPLIEMAKAFNQVGGGLSWEGSEAMCRGGQGLSMDGSSPFVGGSQTTFALMLCAALAQQANCRFSGGPELKLMDVGPYSRLLPSLGARLAPIDRRAPGLPVRLESGVETPREVGLPEDCPEEMAAGLALFAWRFEHGLRLRFFPNSPAARGVAEAAPVLARCGIEVRLAPDEIQVSPGTPRVPERPDLPADPVLSTLLLSLARFRKGKVVLIGSADADSPMAAEALGLLEAAGAKLDLAGGRMVCADGPWPETPVFAPRERALLPLALCLASAAPKGARVLLPEGGSDEGVAAEEARTLLETLGKDFVLLGETGGEMDVKPGFTEPRPVYAPDAACALAMGALSLAHAPLALENPGVAAGLWPGFWNLYNRLPAISGSLFARKEKPDEQPKQRRRIIVR
ncbi:5-enolpyruvylshikimate-3-phosphate synthase-like protein [Desulfovibrio sp. X2]|uniref:chorismate mutase n=1 Tax=Desulfovibrio sp. X2 TaxID=941449 RepID=UPI000358DC90|nr:chorismate mutase [Desulfovibrio sp. X2]EPR44430.1 5-enolpyruvylshikimate-3-phosphate synthase-like protein [Desulfovibrio sp. X2]